MKKIKFSMRPIYVRRRRAIAILVVGIFMFIFVAPLLNIGKGDKVSVHYSAEGVSADTIADQEPVEIALNESVIKEKISERKFMKEIMTSAETIISATSFTELAKKEQIAIKALQAQSNVGPEPVKLVRRKVAGRKLSSKDISLLEKLVMAEAGGEPYEGQLAVANVVMNRLDSEYFPDTVRKVIYEKNQFSPAMSGVINKMKPTDSVKKAVREVVVEGVRILDDDVVFFINPDKATNTWVAKTKEFYVKIGGHAFYRVHDKKA